MHATGFVVLDLLVANGTVTPHAGGTAANVAINLAVLGWDTSVSGLLGDDPAGRLIVEELRAFGVSTANLVLRPDVETPVLIHEVLRNRHRFRFSCPVCSRKYAKHRPLPIGLAESAPPATVFFCDRTSAYAVACAERARSRGSWVVFEPGTPGRKDAFERLEQMSSIVRYSDDLRGSILDRLSQTQHHLEVCSLGAGGVRWRGRWRDEFFESWIDQPQAKLVDPVDPGGAGDWLTAGMLHAAAFGAKVSDAVSVGQELARLSCCAAGTRGLLALDEALKRVGSLRGNADFVWRPASPPSLSYPAEARECAAWFCPGAP